MGVKVSADIEASVIRNYDTLGSIRGAADGSGCSFTAAKRILLDAGLLGSDETQGVSKTPCVDFGSVETKLKRRPMTLAEIAGLTEMIPDDAVDWLETLKDSGLNLQEYGGKYCVERSPVPASSIESPSWEIVSDKDNTFTLGAMGDTHLCSKYERLDVLNDLYNQYEAEGVKTVFHGGNWIDGEARFNRHALKVHGMNAQLDYLVEKYPRRPGIDTYAVTGDDHEGWYCQQTGVDIGRLAEMKMRQAGRTDWHDLGYMEAYVKLVNANTGKSCTLAVVHPGGGSAYALSYTVQKIVESYSGGEKPAALFVGHYHKMELLNVRNVWCVQTGCTMDQGTFMRKKRLEAHVGGHVIRFKQDPRTGALLEMNGMKRYFPVEFYNGQWSESGPVRQVKRTLGGA